MAKKKLPSYPPNHEPAMRVPRGGSSCKSCRFFVWKNGPRCVSLYYQDFYGHDVIPIDPNKFCSDWYEPVHL